jgi:hypothetical protein
LTFTHSRHARRGVSAADVDDILNEFLEDQIVTQAADIDNSKDVSKIEAIKSAVISLVDSQEKRGHETMEQVLFQVRHLLGVKSENPRPSVYPSVSVSLSRSSISTQQFFISFAATP